MRNTLRNSPRGRAGAIVGPAVLFAVIGCDDSSTGGGATGGSAGGGSGGSGGLEADAGSGGHVHGGSGGEGGQGGQHMGGHHMGGQHMGGSGGHAGGSGGHAGGSGGHAGGSGGHAGGSGGHAGGSGGHAGGSGGHAGGAGGHAGGAGGHGGGQGGEGGATLADVGVPPPPVDADVPPPPPVDGGMPPQPDVVVPPMMCLDLVGQACDTSNEGCCDAQGNGQVWCQPDANGAMVYQAIPPDFFCNCYVDEATGKTMVACAVPGFVGIDRAHRPRRMGRRLRLAAAA